MSTSTSNMKPADNEPDSSGAPSKLSSEEILSHLRHELRNPINTIIGYSELWLENEDMASLATSRADLSKVQSAGRQLQALVSEILDPVMHAGTVILDMRGLGDQLRQAFQTPISELLSHCSVLLESAASQQCETAQYTDDLRRIETAIQLLLSMVESLAADGQLPDAAVFCVASPEVKEKITELTARYRSTAPIRQTTMAVTRGAILLVDDNAANCELLSRHLQQLGYSVLTEPDGVSALELLDRQKIDLVLLDFQMPMMSGIEVLKCLRCSYTVTDLPVIMVTARDNNDDIVLALECGANDYVTKPFSLPVVAARVHTQLLLKQMAAEQEENNRKLEELTLHDSLTLLANRRCFDETFDREWRRALRHQSLLSMIMLDIDYFKRYNDTYGHEAGDRVLRRVGEALSQALGRAEDSVFRYGGEEFVALLPGIGAGGARRVAEGLRAAIEALAIPHRASHVNLVVTVSIGVATIIPTQDVEAHTLFAQADKMLYQAKAKGRNRVSQAEIE